MVEEGPILSTQNFMLQVRPYFVNSELYVTGKALFCQLRTLCYRSDPILSTQNFMLKVRPYFVNSELYVRGKALFCQLRTLC